MLKWVFETLNNFQVYVKISPDVNWNASMVSKWMNWIVNYVSVGIRMPQRPQRNLHHVMILHVNCTAQVAEKRTPGAATFVNANKNVTTSCVCFSAKMVSWKMKMAVMFAVVQGISRISFREMKIWKTAQLSSAWCTVPMAMSGTLVDVQCANVGPSPMLGNVICWLQGARCSVNMAMWRIQEGVPSVNVRIILVMWVVFRI